MPLAIGSFSFARSIPGLNFSGHRNMRTAPTASQIDRGRNDKDTQIETVLL